MLRNIRLCSVVLPTVAAMALLSGCGPQLESEYVARLDGSAATDPDIDQDSSGQIIGGDGQVTIPNPIPGQNGGGQQGPRDPGIGTGLWIPPGMTPTVYVVDQSLSGTNPTTVTSIPGCLNGGSMANDSNCRYEKEYRATYQGQPVSIQIAAGTVISIRYRVKKDAPASAMGGYFRFTNDIGGVIFTDMTTSLSTTPGDFNVAASCLGKGSLLLGSDPRYCAIDRGQSVYYLNIRFNNNNGAFGTMIVSNHTSVLN